MSKLWRINIGLTLTQLFMGTLFLYFGMKWSSLPKLCAIVALVFLVSDMLRWSEAEDFLLHLSSAVLMVAVAKILTLNSSGTILGCILIFLVLIFLIVATNESRRYEMATDDDPVWMMWLTAFPVLGAVFGGTILLWRKKCRCMLP